MARNKTDKLTTISYIKYILKSGGKFLSPKPLGKMRRIEKEKEHECRYNQTMGEK